MERMTREEAIQYLTMAKDMFDDAVEANNTHEAVKVLRNAGEKVGYTPAFRCLVKGMDPEQSIRWGKVI